MTEFQMPERRSVIGCATNMILVYSDMPFLPVATVDADFQRTTDWNLVGASY